MGVPIRRERVQAVLAAANERAKRQSDDLLHGPAYESWRHVVSRFRDAAMPRTYLAVLSIALTARALYPRDRLNVLHIKAGTSEQGYSASSIGTVLAGFAKEQRIDLRATSSQPMNNQPFTFEDVIRPDMGVQSKHAESWKFFYETLTRVNELLPAQSEAILALVFAMSQKRAPDYISVPMQGGAEELEHVTAVVADFVNRSVDGGRVGQAFGAACLDLIYGPDAVTLGDTQDPDASIPGDVQVRSGENGPAWLWVEVKQKVIQTGDVLGFLEKVRAAGGERVAYLALWNAGYSGNIRLEHVYRRARSKGMSIVVLQSPEEALDWFVPHAPGTFAQVGGRLLERLHARLVESGCHQELVDELALLAEELFS